MEIHYCRKFVFRSGRRLQQGQSASSIYQGLSSVMEVSSPSSPGAKADHLEELILSECDALTGVLHIPPSLRKLEMKCCDGLTSLEYRSGEHPSLQHLLLCRCNTLSSLPDGPQAYSGLQYLYIIDCPGMKTLPISLQQRLGSLQREYIDAHYYGSKRAAITFSIHLAYVAEANDMEMCLERLIDYFQRSGRILPAHTDGEEIPLENLPGS